MNDILILGGGFGGVYTARRICQQRDDVRVTMISNRNYFLFVPMLHEVATGNITSRNIVRPIREILDYDSFRFYQDTVETVDFDEQTVKTENDTYSYDTVVVALGSTTNYFGTEGAKEHCYTLKDLHDAVTIRNDLIDSFESATTTSNPEDALRTVIVGGGPTGVELACEVADWAKHLASIYPVSYEAFSLHLVDLNDKVLNGIDDELRDHAMHVLEEKNVTLHMNTAGDTVTTDEIQLSNGSTLASNTVIWTAGVRPVDIDVNGVELDKGRIPVDQDLTVKDFDNAYALGDIAAFTNPDGESFPPTAQLAYQQAFGVADNILRQYNNVPTQPYTYNPKGFMASLGKGNAVANIHGVHLYGFPAWFLWRTVYLSKLVGWQNTLRVMIDWTFELLTTRDTSRLPE